MPYVITSGIPIPPQSSGRPSRYPFHSMNVGDSILADKKAVNAAHQHGAQHNMKFASRRQPDGQYRVWRIV